MRILLAEDDNDLANMLEIMMTAEGFDIDKTTSGVEALELAKAYEYDLMVLDLGLPDISGYDVIRGLRSSRVATPVLILTGSGDLGSSLKGFELGADEFLAKPFHRRELLARVHSVIRRSKGHSQPKIQIGDITVDLSERLVSVGRIPLHLPGREYQVFETLSLRLDRVVTRDVLLDQIYGGRDEPTPKIIDVFISKLRSRLREVTGGDQYIETIRDKGYILRAPQNMGSRLSQT